MVGHADALYWLSFANPRNERGTQFLGVSLVSASSFKDAIQATWKKHINPGGEVAGFKLSPEFAERVPASYVGRLLNRDECTALQALIDGD